MVFRKSFFESGASWPKVALCPYSSILNIIKKITRVDYSTFDRICFLIIVCDHIFLAAIFFDILFDYILNEHRHQSRIKLTASMAL